MKSVNISANLKQNKDFPIIEYKRQRILAIIREIQLLPFAKKVFFAKICHIIIPI